MLTGGRHRLSGDAPLHHPTAAPVIVDPLLPILFIRLAGAIGVDRAVYVTAGSAQKD
jgi:hypothetical protein